MEKENQKIIEAIDFLKNGKFHERKPYLIEAYRNGTKLNGFLIQKETWCWVIWKATDEKTQPQFKGERLAKAIPDTVPIKNMEDVLNAQPWTYI